jgi:hypothetical protein
MENRGHPFGLFAGAFGPEDPEAIGCRHDPRMIHPLADRTE